MTSSGLCSRRAARSASFRRTAPRLSGLPLYLTEANVDSLLTPADALEAVEGCFRRLAAGEGENLPRRRLRLGGGVFAGMPSVAPEPGLAGGKAHPRLPRGSPLA